MLIDNEIIQYLPNGKSYMDSTNYKILKYMIRVDTVVSDN